MIRLFIVVLAACTPQPQPNTPVAVPAPPPGPTQNLDHGQRDPPLPADNPSWRWNAGGFVADPHWYGEHDWAAVRMRVAGHMAAAGRDLARLRASRGDYAGAAQAYADLAATLDAIPAPQEGIAAEIEGLLEDAARRDAALCAALAGGAPMPAAAGLARQRIRLLDLERSHAAGEDVAAGAQALQADLGSYLTLRGDLDLDAFRDFDDRHRLRVLLVQAALDAQDPLGLNERWGYWEPSEIRRQALILGLAAGELGGDPWDARLAGALEGTVPPPGPDPLLRPSEIAAALRDPDQRPGFGPEELGRLPTGDSLVDVAAFPGPRAIGRLERRGLEDPEHLAWLTAQADALNAALADNPGEALALGREAAAWLDQDPHDSRYYNVKQLRNALVRQLALAGQHDLALVALDDAWPLHNQDWACPNRAGILMAIQGRLQAEAGNPQAEATLEAAMRESRDFLRQVDEAEAAGAAP
ncbi:MAG: hypothetical protein ABIO70_06530 [Pseudomonadota bacterium]